MKPFKLVLLSVAALVLLGLAYLSSRTHRPAVSSLLGEPVLQGIDLNAIRAVEIQRDPQTLRITQTNGHWRIEQAFGYPADFAVLRRNLIELNDLRIDHVQRDFIPAQGVRSTVVRLLGDEDRKLAELRLYPRRAEGYAEGRYIVRNGDKDGWLVKSNLSGFAADVRQWVDTQLLNLPAQQVLTIEMVPDDGPPVVFERKNNTLKMLHLDESEQFDDTRAFGIESALSHLNFQNVADPGLDDALTGLSTGAVFRVTSDGDILYTLRVGNPVPQGNARYVRLSASPAPGEPSGEPDEEVESKVQAFNQRHADWMYTISSHTADNMTQPRDKLVKPAPEPEDPPDESDESDDPDPDETAEQNNSSPQTESEA